MPSTCSSSQTQRSLWDSSSTMLTRASSANAWNQRATRGGSGRVVMADVMRTTYQVFLISQDRQSLTTGQRTRSPVLPRAHSPRERHHVVQSLAAEAVVPPPTLTTFAHQARFPEDS